MQWNEVVDSSHTNNTMGYQQRLQRSGIREQTADLPTMQCDSNNEVNAVEEGLSLIHISEPTRRA